MLEQENFFHKSLQSMIMKVCSRKKTFSPTHKIFEVFLQFLGNDPPFPTDQTPMENPRLWIRLLSHSELMYHFVVSFKAYPEAKISLIAQFSLGIFADLILRINFGRPRCAWLHSHEWTESSRCVCLTTSKKSSSYLSSF